MKTVEINQLFAGDRFMHKGRLWTYLGPDADHEPVARRHSEMSYDLGHEGFGYSGDSVCSFDWGDEVQFVPVRHVQ